MICASYFASQQLALNTYIRTVSHLLGHSDIKTTMNTYSHGSDNLQREEAANKLNGVLKTIYSNPHNGNHSGNSLNIYEKLKDAIRLKPCSVFTYIWWG